MSRLTILENSLAKKKELFSDKLSSHIDTVKQANGQPLNDKRCGASTLSKWDRQNDSLRTLDESIKKTENAIEREKSKIAGVEYANKNIPKVILDLVENGTLNQWRKYPNRFFVNGVEKARIIWDVKDKNVSYKYLRQIPNKEQFDKFKEIYNTLYNQLKQ